MNDYGMSRLSI